WYALMPRRYTVVSLQFPMTNEPMSQWTWTRDIGHWSLVIPKGRDFGLYRLDDQPKVALHPLDARDPAVEPGSCFDAHEARQTDQVGQGNPVIHPLMSIEVCKKLIKPVGQGPGRRLLRAEQERLDEPVRGRGATSRAFLLEH